MITAFRKVLLLTIIALSTAARAQSVLDQYITDGLHNNIVLKQRNISLEKAMTSLKIANSYFAPAIGVQGNYTSGLGGRSIAIPVGDLLNPVYTTLNQLTASDKFPNIQNVDQNFFPYNFYDAKLHTTLPLINTDLIYNRKIAQQQVVMQEYEVVIYKRELIKNIKVAYYNYLSALEAVRIYESAMARSEEGRRVSESLMQNGKGLAAYVLRSQSEIESVRAEKSEAERQVENARMYFNFLLNRSTHEPILIASDDQPLIISDIDSVSVENREELKLLRESIELNLNVKRMSNLFWLPKINGFLDLGSQAQDWKMSNQTRYYLWGLQLDVPLFNGMRNRNKIKLADLDAQSATLGYSSNRQQINLAAQTARNTFFTSQLNYTSARKQQEAAQSYERLIEKGYKEGVNTFIEVIDARNQLTQSQLQVTLNRYRVLSAAAQLERETASYSIPQTEN